MTEAGTGAGRLIATASQTVGPFFHFGLTPRSGERTGQDAIELVVRITDSAGEPVSDALVELWHAVGPAEAAPPGDTGGAPSAFARMPTSEDGAFTVATVMPARVAAGSGEAQAAHINLCLFARGLLRQLHTRIYFEGDPGLGADAVLALVPEERRGTLLASPDPAHPGRWLFHLRLQGADETVFFDV